MGEVKVGQVWRDTDPRSYGRKMRVVAIDGEHAQLTNVGGGRWSPNGRTTWVAIRRMKPGSRGYRLIEDVTDE